MPFQPKTTTLILIDNIFLSIQFRPKRLVMSDLTFRPELFMKIYKIDTYFLPKIYVSKNKKLNSLDIKIDIDMKARTI